MIVEFLMDWRGSKKGDKVDMNNDAMAIYDLIPRKIVKALPTTDALELAKQKRIIDEQAAKIAQLEAQATEAKELKAAPKDTMIRGPAKTK